MKRSSLGRGLAAIIPDNVLVDEERSAKSTEALRLIPIDQIRPNPEQPRMTFQGQALEQLAESIRTHGVLTPLLVRRDDRGHGYILVAGERRLRATGLAGLEEVPCWVRDHLSTQDQLELALVENIQREDLDPIECAESYHRLVSQFNMTQAEVARRVGKDRATVANAIRLLRLPSFALAELRAGNITAGHGKALLSLNDAALIRRVMREVIAKDMSVRATERTVSEMVRGKAPRSRARSTVMQQLSGKLSRVLNAKVKVEARNRSQKGRIVIDFATREELDRLVGLLNT